MNPEQVLTLFIKKIKQEGLELPMLQISRLGNLTFVSARTENPTTIMANDVTAGVDFDPNKATLKALVEYFERACFSYGVDQGNPVCERRHSDGVAAFPTVDINASTIARKNAINEAFERFVWSHWWDNRNIAHNSVLIEKSQFWGSEKLKKTVKAFQKIIPLKSLSVITPFHSLKDHNVLILIAELRDGGFISGGAAGETKQNSSTIVRALAELIRHGLGVQKFKQTELNTSTFYEERLMYFGSGKGDNLVFDRLNSNGKEIVQLPSLKIDSEIEAPIFKNIVYAHRCLFVDQPPFVDGRLERLCL